ncbi:MAG: glycosyltransferase family 2 protein [Dehalococcoidia bacterium]
MNPTMIVALAQMGVAGGVALVSGWWTVLAIIALPRPQEPRSRNASPLKMSVIVPAHNEEALIAQTVRSLREAGSQVAPEPGVLVIADNCSDGTEVEAANAGAHVLVRTSETQRGKSFALEFALAHLRDAPEPPEAVVFVDADTTVSENFFTCIAHRLQSGAEAVQVHYEAAPGDTAVSRLRRLAFGLVHWSRPLGASRLGLPTTLKGNGMAFRWPVIQDGFPGVGITEDAAATLALAERGTVIHFEPRATVSGLMATSYGEASVQDERWEGGRLGMAPRSLLVGIRLLARGEVRAAGAAFELASPPLTLVVAGAAVSLAIAVAGAGSLLLGAVATGLSASYVAIGLIAARAAREDLAAMVHVPRFVLHKMVSYGRLIRGQPKTWERTAR